MPIDLFVLVQVEKGEPWVIAKKILEIEGVKSAYAVTGQYDVISFAELSDASELKNLIKKIHGVEGVQHTQTAVCIP